MANDPGLENDSCIFVEAITGDGGAHNASDIFWLSPDIKLVGPASGLDIADASQINPITVDFHRKPAGSNCTFPGDESLNVEVWVANPSLVMSPHIKGSSSRVGFIGAPVPAEDTRGSQQIDWNVPPAPHPGNPQNPGPKCLVARAYPSSGIASDANFFLPGDQHVAQRNLCVVTGTAKPFAFEVNTVGFGHPQIPFNPVPNARLKAFLDLHPSHFVTRTVRGRLRFINGSPGLLTVPLSGGFGFDVSNLSPSNVVDHSHPPFFPPLRNANPSFEASVFLEPGRVISIKFVADLQSLPANQACIFHLMQTDLTNAVLGGLTLVVVRAS